MKPNEIFNTENTGFVSFEEIENAFKTPTQYQNFYEQPAAAQGPVNEPSDDLPPNLVDPDGTAFSDFERIEDAPEQVSPEKAQRTGMRIARLVDTGIDFALSNFVAHNDKSYKADERDLQDIGECWGELAEEKGWSIGPEWSLIILYIMVYGPLVKQSVADRRFAEIEARQEAMQAQINTIQMQQAMQQQPIPQPAKPANDGNADPNTDPTSAGSPFTYQPRQ